METIFQAIGITGGEAGIFAAVIIIARFGAKLIPDSAEGILGVVRKVLKVLGAYTENQK